MGREPLNPHTAAQADAAIGYQLGGAYIEVVARAPPQELHEHARVVGAEVEQETGFLQAPVEVGVLDAHRVVDRLLPLGQQLVGNRSDRHVRLLGGDAPLQRLLRI